MHDLLSNNIQHCCLFVALLTQAIFCPLDVNCGSSCRLSRFSSLCVHWVNAPFMLLDCNRYSCSHPIVIDRITVFYQQQHLYSLSNKLAIKTHMFTTLYTNSKRNNYSTCRHVRDCLYMAVCYLFVRSWTKYTTRKGKDIKAFVVLLDATHCGVQLHFIYYWWSITAGTGNNSVEWIDIRPRKWCWERTCVRPLVTFGHHHHLRVVMTTTQSPTH